MITRTGWGAAVASGALLIIGLAFGYHELTTLGVAGVVALLLAVAMVVRRPGLVVEREIQPARNAR